MNLGFSTLSQPNQISNHLWQRMAKKIVVLVLAASITLTAWGFLGKAIFRSIYHLDSVASAQDGEILGQTNAAVDLAMRLVSSTTGRLAEPSFGAEVHVETALAENPFIPLVSPVQDHQDRPRLAANSEDSLFLKGVAKIGERYLAILADANDVSQVVFEGAEFNGWQVFRLQSDAIILVKGNRRITLAWEGIR